MEYDDRDLYPKNQKITKYPDSKYPLTECSYLCRNYNAWDWDESTVIIPMTINKHKFDFFSLFNIKVA